MKSIFFILLIVITALPFTSCEKRNHVCTCSDTSGYVWSRSIIHSTERKAKEECTATSTGPTIKCEIEK